MSIIRAATFGGAGWLDTPSAPAQTPAEPTPTVQPRIIHLPSSTLVHNKDWTSYEFQNRDVPACLASDVVPAKQPGVPAPDGWLDTPFGRIPTGLPSENERTALPKAFHRYEIGLHPGLAEGALRLHFENAYILWALLRCFDASKSGSINLASFMAYDSGRLNGAGLAQRPVMTKSVLYRALDVGQSIGLFRITRGHKGTNIHPCSLDKAVAILGAKNLGALQLVRPTVLTSFAGRRAWLLAIATGKPFDVLEGKDAPTRKARMAGWSRPRSRANIAASTGVAVRTQRRLNHQAGVHKVAHQQAIESPSQEGVYVATDRQLPNSYLTRATPGKAGRQRPETRSALKEQRANAGSLRAFGTTNLVGVQSQSATHSPSEAQEVSQHVPTAQRPSLDLRKRFFWTDQAFTRTKAYKRNSASAILLWNGNRPQKSGKRYLWS